MKTITNKIRALWAKLPPRAQSAIRHFVITFGVVFLAAAKPLLPAVFTALKQGDYSTAKSLIVALVLGAGAAAIRVVVPILVGYAKSLVAWFVAKYL